MPVEHRHHHFVQAHSFNSPLLLALAFDPRYPT
jgi:hypothetical protein